MDSDETGTLAVDELKLSPKFVGVFGWHLIGASVSEPRPAMQRYLYRRSLARAKPKIQSSKFIPKLT